MKRNARLFAVMLGLGVAGGAWAARPPGAVGPVVIVDRAVRTQKAVGPELVIEPAVRTQKAVGPDLEIMYAVRTQKAVGPRHASEVHTGKAVEHGEKQAGHRPVLDLNAGF